MTLTDEEQKELHSLFLEYQELQGNGSYWHHMVIYLLKLAQERYPEIFKSEE